MRCSKEKTKEKVMLMKKIDGNVCPLTKNILHLCALSDAVIAQLVEHWLPKPKVTGSSPAYRSYSASVS